jgi:enamine deaminase RidA (YjgF/YER057c/UK114 family)
MEKFERTLYSSGAPLEEKAGYSRAIKIGSNIFVGGTTSVQPDGNVFGEHDGYAQTKYVLEKMIGFVEKAGGKKADIYRVKIYCTDMSKSKDVIQAYSEFFKEIKPLCTVVGIAALNRPTQVVEIEIDALMNSAN